MATLTLAAVAFLKGYMYKEAADPYANWLKQAGPSAHYNAIADAEHRNRPGTRFIRAGHYGSGSSAYGPVQANKSYLQDFAPTGRYKDVLSGSPRLQGYVGGLASQADKFLQHGNMKGRMKGKAHRGSTVAFGEYGLQATDRGRITVCRTGRRQSIA